MGTDAANAPLAEPPARTGQPAGVLASWIGEVLEEVRSQPMARFAQLRSKLQAEMFEWEEGGLARSVRAMLEEAQALDLAGLRRRNILMRLAGVARRRSRRAAERFDAVVAAASKMKEQAAQLASTHRTHTAGARRVLVDLELEYKRVDHELAQAVAWLEEMADDLAARKLRGAFDAKALALAGKLEMFTGALKRLQSASHAAADLCTFGLEILARRAGLLDTVRTHLDGYEKVWLRRLGAAAAQVRARPSGVVPELQKAIEAHAELVKRLETTRDACHVLHADGRAIDRRLSLFREQLDELLA